MNVKGSEKAQLEELFQKYRTGAISEEELGPV